jgi:hypothetical protein
MSTEHDNAQDEDFWEYDLYAEHMALEVQKLLSSDRSDARLEAVADHMREHNKWCFYAGGIDPTHSYTLADLSNETREKVQAFLDGKHTDTRWLHLLALLVELDEAAARVDEGWLEVDPALRALFNQVPPRQHP